MISFEPMAYVHCCASMSPTPPSYTHARGQREGGNTHTHTPTRAHTRHTHARAHTQSARERKIESYIHTHTCTRTNTQGSSEGHKERERGRPSCTSLEASGKQCAGWTPLPAARLGSATVASALAASWRSVVQPYLLRIINDHNGSDVVAPMIDAVH